MTRSFIGPAVRNVGLLTLLAIGGCSSYHYDPLADPRVRAAVNSECTERPINPGSYSVQQLGDMADCTARVEKAVGDQESAERKARLDAEVARDAPGKAREIWEQIQRDPTHSNPFQTDLYFFTQDDYKHALVLAVEDELRKTYGLKIDFSGGFLSVVLPTSQQR